MVVRFYVVSTVLLLLYPGVRILLIEVEFACNLFILYRYHFRVWVALRLLMVEAANRVLIRPCGLFSMGI